MTGEFELYLIMSFVGILGYGLLQQDNPWFKVVGGTLTVLLILGVLNLLFFNYIINEISSRSYY